MVVIALLPLVYLLVKWETIPDIVPVHFNGAFEPDRYDSKNTLWLMAGVISGVSMLTYFLLENLHRIDPKRKGKELPSVFKKLSVGIVILCSALGLLIIASCIGPAHSFDKLLLPLLGFMFVFIGDLMHSIKPNYFAGIRIPWTLNSDDNWRRTHQFAGKVWFGVGLLMVLLGFVLPITSFQYIVLVAVVLLVALPVGYSYNIYSKEKKN